MEGWMVDGWVVDLDSGSGQFFSPRQDNSGKISIRIPPLQYWEALAGEAHPDGVHGLQCAVGPHRAECSLEALPDTLPT